MMFDTNTVLVALLAVVIFFFFRRRNKSKDAGKRYPPSIPALPFLGSIPFYTGGLDALHIFFMQKSQQLGPIFSLKAGTRMAISLNGKEAIMESMQRHAEAFGDRPDFWIEANILNRDFRGIIFSHYDQSFKHYKKLTLSILKEFGFGTNQETDMRISQETEWLNKEIRKQNGSPFEPKSVLMRATSNVFMTILFGSESQAGMDRSQLIKDSNEFLENMDARIDYAPFVRFLPSLQKTIERTKNAQKRMFDQIEKAIEHTKTNPTERSFVSRFLEIEGPKYSHQDLIYILRDLCLGSTDTVEVTLSWALVELANHPKVQSRLHNEIDEVCSGNRVPSVDDKPRLPYTEAVMFEAMRRHTLVCNPAGRITMKDTEICGYFIPRGCLAIANMYSAHMDPKAWGDPKNFRPERFLDNDNKVIRRDDIFSFNFGKRSCIGELLARQEVFLFLANLVKHFDIRPPEGQAMISVKEASGLVVSPSPFKIRLIQRN
jgi:cytochrome P450